MVMDVTPFGIATPGWVRVKGLFARVVVVERVFAVDGAVGAEDSPSVGVFGLVCRTVMRR